MKDSRDPFSGETYLLPEELAKKYADAEALEIEYLSSKQSGLVHPDDLAVIKAEAMTASEVYRQAITERMPADVQAHVAFDRRAHGLENLKEPTELTIQQQEDLLRISDISLHRIENEYIYLSFHIQCRVDGRQQPAKPIYANDHMLFCNNQISKEELAMLYFGNALHAEREHAGERGAGESGEEGAAAELRLGGGGVLDAGGHGAVDVELVGLVRGGVDGVVTEGMLAEGVRGGVQVGHW